MIIAVDTGGTKTLIARFEETREIQESITFPTPKDTQEYVAQVSQTIQDLAGEAAPSAISIAVPGTIEDNIIKLCINLGWYNFDLIAELRKTFPETIFLLNNDANLGGVGEARTLAKLPPRCLYVTLGTGIGTGFILNGRVAPSLIDSEAGHMQFLENGEMVSWEELAGGIRLNSEFGSISDIESDEIFEEIGRRVAKGLLVLLPTFRPQIVIIGGGIGAYYQWFAKTVDRYLESLPEAFHFKVPVVQATKPKEAVAYGCYFVATDALADQ